MNAFKLQKGALMLDNPSGNGNPQPVLRISNLSKIYMMGEVRVDALKHVSLDFYSGELAVLLGASGSGKSTLINIIGGLDLPSSGNLFFHGREITAATEAELTLYRRRSIGFVFQFYNLISSLSALENVQLVTEIAENPMPAEEAPHPNPQDQGRGGADVTMIISQPFQGVRPVAIGTVFWRRHLPVILLLGILLGGQ